MSAFKNCERRPAPGRAWQVEWAHYGGRLATVGNVWHFRQTQLGICAFFGDPEVGPPETGCRMKEEPGRGGGGASLSAPYLPTATSPFFDPPPLASSWNRMTLIDHPNKVCSGASEGLARPTNASTTLPPSRISSQQSRSSPLGLSHMHYARLLQTA